MKRPVFYDKVSPIKSNDRFSLILTEGEVKTTVLYRKGGALT